MKMPRQERSPYRRVAASSCPERLPGEAGFTLIEAMICVVILTVGMLAIAGLLAVTTQMHLGAREAARSTRLAQDKIDDLMKLNFANLQVAVGGSLTADDPNHSETPPPPAPASGITLRWAVAAGPTCDPLLPALPCDTRVLTVRVLNLRAQLYPQVDLTTIIRQW